MNTIIASALKALHHRPIAYYPCYADMMGSVSGGVILSQLMYWYAAHDGQPFMLTDRTLQAETHVTLRELREAKVRLKRLPFLTIARKGIPATTWYEADLDKLCECLAQTQSHTINAPTGKHVTTSCNVGVAIHPIDSQGSLDKNSVQTGCNTVVTTGLNDGVTTANNEHARVPDLKETKGKEKTPSVTATAVTSSPAAPNKHEDGQLGLGITDEHSLPGTPEPAAPAVEQVTGQWLVETYNAETPQDHPKHRVVSALRQKRANEYARRFPDPAFWHTVFAEVEASPWLRGHVASNGRRPQKRDLFWMLQCEQGGGQENCIKVYEGKYRDEPEQSMPRMSEKGMRTGQAAQRILEEIHSHVEYDVTPRRPVFSLPRGDE